MTALHAKEPFATITAMTAEPAGQSFTWLIRWEEYTLLRGTLINTSDACATLATAGPLANSKNVPLALIRWMDTATKLAVIAQVVESATTTKGFALASLDFSEPDVSFRLLFFKN